MRLPFASMNWFLFLSLAEVRGDFLKHRFCGSPVPPALLLLMAGKVSFGMCGGWHIWSRRSFHPKPRKFCVLGGRMRTKSELKFSRSLINFGDKTFRGWLEHLPVCWLPGLPGTKGGMRDRYFKSHVSFQFFHPLDL